MKLSINWGWRIAIAYSLFVVGMLWLVLTASRQPLDLVSEDYYAREMRFQERIDARRNSNDLDQKLRFSWTAATKELQVEWPEAIEDATGTLLLYCPADATRDREFPITPSNSTLDLNDLASGFWRVQLDWQAGGKTYFDESTVMIP